MSRNLSFSLMVALFYTFSSQAFAGTITASADAGGSITPSGMITLDKGVSQTFLIASKDPKKYPLITVYVDGVSKGAISRYTFFKVGKQSKHTIYAKFGNAPPPVVSPVPKPTPTPTPVPTAPVVSQPAPGVAPTPVPTTPVVSQPAPGVATTPVPTTPVVSQPAPGVTPTPVPTTPVVSQPAPGVTPTPVPTTPVVSQPAPGVAPTPVPTAPVVSRPAPGLAPAPAPTEPSVSIIKLAVNVGWTMPTKRANGATLLPADIVGYEIYFTSLDGKVVDVVSVNSPTTTSAVVTVPVAGTYYFSIATLAINNEKSDMSDPVEVIVK